MLAEVVLACIECRIVVIHVWMLYGSTADLRLGFVVVTFAAQIGRDLNMTDSI